MERTIALLTDFGIRDSYVGVMKAVMARICPAACFIDLTHDVQPQNIVHGAFTLLNSYAYFPPGTIFLVVVDPGVGSARKAIAVEAGDYFFVAPDNGVLSYTLSELEGYTMVELTNPAFRLPAVSTTFHGRDIFAPAAAHLAAGVPLSAFGPPVESSVQLSSPVLEVSERRIRGQIIHVDHFGNLITSIGAFRWDTNNRLELKPRFGKAPNSPLDIQADQSIITIKGQSIRGIRRSYGEAKADDVVILIDSSGYLEIAVNQSSAAMKLQVNPGEPVELQIG